MGCLGPVDIPDQYLGVGSSRDGSSRGFVVAVL